MESRQPSFHQEELAHRAAHCNALTLSQPAMGPKAMTKTVVFLAWRPQASTADHSGQLAPQKIPVISHLNYQLRKGAKECGLHRQFQFSQRPLLYQRASPLLGWLDKKPQLAPGVGNSLLGTLPASCLFLSIKSSFYYPHPFLILCDQETQAWPTQTSCNISI